MRGGLVGRPPPRRIHPGGFLFFRGLTALRADGEIAGGRIGPFGDAEIGERQVLGLLWDGVGVDPKRERRVRMTELV